jgi:hypothetical protein
VNHGPAVTWLLINLPERSAALISVSLRSVYLLSKYEHPKVREIKRKLCQISVQGQRVINTITAVVHGMQEKVDSSLDLIVSLRESFGSFTH